MRLHLAHLALYLVKCYGVFYGVFYGVQLLTWTPSRARRIRVLGLSPRPTTRPPRCFVRVVGLGGWCSVQRRARDGERSANGRDQRQGIGQDQSGRAKFKSTATGRSGRGRDVCEASSARAKGTADQDGGEMRGETCEAGGEFADGVVMAGGCGAGSG